MQLLPFQQRFVERALSPRVDTAVLSIARGNGKSALAGHLLSRIMSPGDGLFRAGTESVLCAASIEQARIVFRFARSVLEPTGEYRFIDSATRVAILHKPTNTRLRVIGSNGKTAMGLVNCPWAICDEPGAWEAVGGSLMRDAIMTSQGKPESPLKVLMIGTQAPAIGKWWTDMIADGSSRSTHVTAIVGDRAKWDDEKEIRRCNPLMWKFANSRRKLREELAQAQRDSAHRAKFMSYRLNIPTGDEATVLLTPDMWELAVQRQPLGPAGRFTLGVDLGHSRAWSAAVAIWENGYCEALALTPGIPDLADQEKRDRVSSGQYRKIADTGRLAVASGLRVPDPRTLVEWVEAKWGEPETVVCDFFRLAKLRDAAPRWNIQERRIMPSESNEDVSALRKIALDGPLNIDRESLPLVSASVSVAKVENDKRGNTIMVKEGVNNRARDDVAAALVLAAGHHERKHRIGDLIRVLTLGG